MSPIVSVITPTFNHEKFIEDCIQSLLKQSFSDWEMIIINDGSQDNTLNIAASFASKDNRIHIINQENKGLFKLAETYNLALSYSSGKYISILEGDDLWVADKLSWQIEVLEKDPTLVLAWGRVSLLNSNNNSVTTSVPLIIPDDNRYQNNPPGKILKTLLFENPIPAVSITIRREKLIQCGGFLQNFNLPLVDLPTILALSLLGPFYFDDRILGFWRVYEFQATKTFAIDILKGRRDLCLHHFSELNSSIREYVSVNEDDLKKYYQDQLLITYVRSGRYKLIRKDFKGAKQDYKNALFFQGFTKPIWRLQAIIGLIFGLFKTDIEGFARFLGKESFKK